MQSVIHTFTPKEDNDIFSKTNSRDKYLAFFLSVFQNYFFKHVFYYGLLTCCLIAKT